MNKKNFFIVVIASICCLAASAQTSPQVRLVSRTLLHTYKPGESSVFGMVQLMSGSGVIQTGNIAVLQDLGTFNMKTKKEYESNFISGYDLEAKKTVWTRFLPESANGSIQAGEYLIATSQKHVTAIDIQSGKVQWQFDGKGVIYNSFTMGAAEINAEVGDGSTSALCVFKTCKDKEGKEISIFDCVTGLVTILSPDGKIIQSFKLNAEITKLLGENAGITFRKKNSGYYINSDNIFYALSDDGNITGKINHEGTSCTVYDDGTAVYLCSKGAITEYSADLAFLRRITLKSKDQNASVSRTGDMLLVYAGIELSLLAPDGTFTWTYRSDKTAFKLFGQCVPPMLLTPVYVLPAYPDLLTLRYNGHLAFVTRDGGKKVGEYIFGSEKIGGLKGMMKVMMMKSNVPLFSDEDGYMYMIVTETEKKMKGKPYSDYLYELEIK